MRCFRTCSGTWRAALAALALLLPLAACQEPPKPFRSLDPLREQPLALPSGPSAVVIGTIAGAPASQALARTLAEALSARDVPAATGRGNLRSWRIEAAAEASPAPGASPETTLVLHWRLSDAAGQERAKFDQAVTANANDWRKGAPGLLKRLADETASHFLPHFGDAKAPNARAVALTIHAIDGAPGDGARSLRHAIEQALARRSFLVRPDISETGFVITAEVRVSPGGAEGDFVRIEWSALAPDGASIGTVEQQNRVPAGSLSGPWGITAVHIAEAAAPGIARLLAKGNVRQR